MSLLDTLSSAFSTPTPSVAVEIAPDRVTAVQIEMARSGIVVNACAVESLPAGAVRPSVTSANLTDAGAVQGALERAFEHLGRRVRRVALIIPDAAAKVSVLRFEHVPGRPRDLDQLVRWQLRKSAPFKIEEAQIAYAPGAEIAGGGREFVVTVIRREIVQEYERVCAAAGAYAGLVDLATFNLINAAVAAGVTGGRAYADWLLVNVTSDYSTIAVVRGEDPIVMRTRPADEGTLADLVHQTAMYHEDRLGGGGFARVLVGGSSLSTGIFEELGRAVQERLGLTVDMLDPLRAARLRDRITASPNLVGALAAPVGILLRERAA